VLPITCIALVLRPGHATGGARALMWTCWGLWQRLVATWAEFQHSVVYYATERCRKDRKHVLMQKVVTLNTCCDIACLTFQLPLITTGSFQSHRRQPRNWLFSEPPTCERTQQTFSQMKKFRNSQVSVVIFSDGVGKWIVFVWNNVNYQKYVWIILLKLTFFDFLRYSGYIWQARWTICKIFVSNFLTISHAKNH